jgi:peptide chain release factor 3
MGRGFSGVFDLQRDRMRLFRPGADGLDDADEIIEGLGNAEIDARFGNKADLLRQEIELIRGASPEFSREAFLAGRQTPIFFGSAINNFGVREILDALVDLAPSPGAHRALQREVQPDESRLTGVVFKIQANMNPAHRDRIAFVRICSGRFDRGMNLRIVRNEKDIRTNGVVSFLSQRRELLETAYPGDIVGIPNHGTIQLGDTLTEGERLQYTGLPFFAPEIFQSVELADPMRSKQLKLGLAQLGEEGAIQVFRPHAGGALLLGAVGTLQFEVVAHRLKHEYGVDARLIPSKYQLARWITAEDPRELKRFIDANAHRIAYDAVNAPAFLASFGAELSVAEESWRSIRFHRMREHAGLVFQTHAEA